MRKHKSNFSLVNEFYELEDRFQKLPSDERVLNWGGRKDILSNYPITICNFNKTKKYLLELNQFDFIIYASEVFCKKDNLFDILIALKEKLSKASFGNIRVSFKPVDTHYFLRYVDPTSYLTNKELMKLISLRNHQSFDNIIMLVENGQMDIVNSLTL
jgi:hypothetical protein